MHDVETMMSVRSVPWHGLGNVLPTYPKTREEILIAAGLNWEVTELPVEVPLPDGTSIVATDKKAIVRLTDNTLMSIMGGGYTPIQPHQLVDFAFALLEVGDADDFEIAGKVDGDPPILFETAMSLAGGRINTLMARIPAQVKIGGEDAVTLYIGFVTSHDGSMRFGAHVTPIREVCKNTLNLGLRHATQNWSVKHTSGALSMVAEARKTLRLTFDYRDEFEQEMNRLLDQEFTKAQFERMVTELWPKPPSEEAPFSREQYSMIGLLESSPTIPDNIRYTRYGAINAVTEYHDWNRRFNNTGESIQEKRTMATMFGDAKKNADKALAYLS